MNQLQHFSLIIIAIILTVSLHTVQAQDSSTPPAVISLTADVLNISLSEAEAGTTPATLRWAVTELRESDRVLLQWLVGTQWTTLNAEGEILPPVGELTINITHPQ
ncbi:MAG TPA: hypothetical protein VJZ27_07495, partial [Aggregatilineales bacterium]|nr:hypothetical protein [Aggregatilineales bacterium]